jgi:hypothetical protein
MIRLKKSSILAILAHPSRLVSPRHQQIGMATVPLRLAGFISLCYYC